MNEAPEQSKHSENDTSHSQTRQHDTRDTSFRSLALYVIIAGLCALGVRHYIAAPYVVSGASMVPTFHDFNYLIVDQVSYHFSDPERGDVIVFDLPQNTSRALIKRIIGLPGEIVELENGTVRIINDEYPEGFILEEPYLDPDNMGGASDLRYVLGNGQYFVLGDNRKVSADSRSWGALPRHDIIGRAYLRLFPFTEIDYLPGQFRYQGDSPTIISS